MGSCCLSPFEQGSLHSRSGPASPALGYSTNRVFQYTNSGCRSRRAFPESVPGEKVEHSISALYGSARKDGAIRGKPVNRSGTPKKPERKRSGAGRVICRRSEGKRARNFDHLPSLIERKRDNRPLQYPRRLSPPGRHPGYVLPVQVPHSHKHPMAGTSACAHYAGCPLSLKIAAKFPLYAVKTWSDRGGLAYPLSPFGSRPWCSVSAMADVPVEARVGIVSSGRKLAGGNGNLGQPYHSNIIAADILI